MSSPEPIVGVYLSEKTDLKPLYAEAFERYADQVVMLQPSEVTRPEDVRFALCWLPGPEAFAPYPNLGVAMSVGAGVDALLAHPGLTPEMAIARVRDPHQGDQMAGYVAHQILERERGFGAMRANAVEKLWTPTPLRPPAETTVAVLGHGTMGRAVARGLRGLGFSLRVACRTAPEDPIEQVTYLTGDGAVQEAATGADYLVNVLPLTDQTRNILNADLFARLAPNAWLIQIGRGEHLVEQDLQDALSARTLGGATLDVFRTEPLPAEHRFWQDQRLVITPHIASDTAPQVVAQQMVSTAFALQDGKKLDFAIDRARGY